MVDNPNGTIRVNIGKVDYWPVAENIYNKYTIYLESTYGCGSDTSGILVLSKYDKEKIIECLMKYTDKREEVIVDGNIDIDIIKRGELPYYIHETTFAKIKKGTVVIQREKSMYDIIDLCRVMWR